MENKCSDPELCCFFMCRSASALLCSALPALICSVLLSFFHYLFLQTFRLLSALSDIPSVCSSFRLLCSHTFHSSFLRLSALLFLLCSSCSARRGGGYPFLTKISFSFLPPKIPDIFPKNLPSHHTFNTPLTHI